MGMRGYRHDWGSANCWWLGKGHDAMQQMLAKEVRAANMHRKNRYWDTVTRTHYTEPTFAARYGKPAFAARSQSLTNLQNSGSSVGGLAAQDTIRRSSPPAASEASPSARLPPTSVMEDGTARTGSRSARMLASQRSNLASSRLVPNTGRSNSESALARLCNSQGSVRSMKQSADGGTSRLGVELPLLGLTLPPSARLQV
mmetsp:Transcript_114861/g.214984  ORF Transcript_114861/g.214984 Transcript_114861/m.214984 type:complete len:200 (+) Transcript_114861:50-649(+)